MIALLDAERPELRPWFIIGFAAAEIALLGLSRGWRWSGSAGAVGLFFPIGMLAQSNGASPWLWIFWVACAAATERWIRDGIVRKGPAADT